MTADEIKKMVKRFAEEVWSTGNASILDELCAPDYVFRNIIDGSGGSLEDQKNNLLDAKRMVPDLKLTVAEIIVGEDGVAYQWTMEGTFEGERTRRTGITMLRLRDGKVVDDRFVADMETTGKPASLAESKQAEPTA